MITNSWLVWSVPLAVASLILLIFVILKLVTKIRDAELLSVSLSEEAVVNFSETGKVQMHIASPRSNRVFAGLTSNMINVASRKEVPRSMSVPLRSAGLSEVKLAHSIFSIENAGEHLLQIEGLDANKDYSKCRILFTRPYALYVVLCVIGLVTSGGGFIGGIVMSLMYLSGTH